MKFRVKFMLLLVVALVIGENQPQARGQFSGLISRGNGQVTQNAQAERRRRREPQPAPQPQPETIPPQSAPGKTVYVPQPQTQTAKPTPQTGLMQSLPDEGRRRAIVVTVERHNDSLWSRLPGVDATGDKLCRNLLDGGFSPKDVLHLSTSAQGQSSVPDAETIRQKIQQFAADSSQADLLLVCLIGHGFGAEVPAGGGRPAEKRAWFVAKNTPHSVRGVPAQADRQAVSIQALVSMLAAAKAEQKVLMVDACQDQKGADGPTDIDVPLATRGSLWVLTSCSPGQTALIDRDPQSGNVGPVFSGHFADALNWRLAFDDDGDGVVTIREAWRHAYQKSRRPTQVPVCLVGSGIIPLVQLPVQIPEVALVSGNAEEERRLAAGTLCNSGSRLLERGYSEVTEATVEALKAQQKVDPEIYNNYRLVANYVLGNYVPEARQFYEDSREECLLRARHLRAIGDYSGALTEFEKVGEPLIVFANGRLPDSEFFYGTEQGRAAGRNITNDTTAESLAKQAAPGVSVEEILKNLSTVPVFAEPMDDGSADREIQSSMALTITKTTVSGTETWLQISEVENDGERLQQPMWIRARDVHWFREAAQMYLPGSDLHRQISSILGSHQRNAEVFWTSRGRLQRLRDAIARVQRAQRALAIARRFGAPIPGQVDQALGIVQTALSIAESAVMRKQQQNYVVYSSATKVLDFQKLQYLQASFRELNAGREKPAIRIKASPWLADDSQ